MNRSAVIEFPSKKIWLVAIFCAALGVIPVIALSNIAPWLIAVPILAGTLVVGLLELAPILRGPEKQLQLISNPREFLGLARYKGHFALVDLVNRETSQGTFDFLQSPRRMTTKSARIIRDPETGERIYIIDTERFVSMLLKHYLPNVDKVAEVSLVHALHRYGEMTSMSSELERFVRDKTVLEVIKNDFKGNAAQAVNRSSEAVIREVIKQVKEKGQVELNEVVS